MPTNAYCAPHGKRCKLFRRKIEALLPTTGPAIGRAHLGTKLAMVLVMDGQSCQDTMSEAEERA